jgi:SAM-dependent methyltransferase
MRTDVEELRAFYATRPGQLARRLVNAQLQAMWPDLAGRTVVGVGYPLPFLGAMGAAATVAALMPVGQGAERWPGGGASAVALVPDDELPLADGSVDRLLIAHAVETCPDLRRFLREAWRVLADGGRLVALVPNRRGFWCWSDGTPFGQGQPYSSGQIRRALRAHLFEPTAERSALFLPPLMARWWPRLAVPFERVGLRLVPGLSGVILLEAEKRILIGTPVGAPATAAARRYVGVPEGALARSRPEPPARSAAVNGAAAAASSRPPAPPSSAGRGPAP